MNNDDIQHQYDTLRENAARYYELFVETVLDAVIEKQLNLATGMSTLLSAASAVAAQLDEPGIELFESTAADIVEHMRRSKAQYDAAVDPGRLQ